MEAPKMSKSAKTVVVFGMYLVGMGLGFLIMPNVLFSMLQLPLTDEVWSRVVGMLALLLAYYYINAARSELRPFFAWTVHTRLAAFLFFVGFTIANLSGPMLAVLGGVDLVTAIWTARTLKQEASQPETLKAAAVKTI
jgi:hypothetical protein